LNSASYGVPQTRKRLILIAIKGNVQITIPPPTHSKDGKDGLPRWRGWYEAIVDLIPTLPETKFAPWQIKRLEQMPHLSNWLFNGQEQDGRDSSMRAESEPCLTVTSAQGRRPSQVHHAFLQMTGCSSSHPQSGGSGVKWIDVPAGTVTTRSTRMATGFVPDEVTVEEEVVSPERKLFLKARAFICAEDSKMVTREADAPAGTQVASPRNLNQKAFIVEGSAAGEDNKFTLPTRNEDDPVFTMRARQNNPRAFIANGTPNDRGQSLTSRDDGEPVFTVTAQTGNRQAARIGLEGGRVVAMTPRALARFMSLPDSYELSGNRALDGKGLGNGVPCLLAKCVIEHCLSLWEKAEEWPAPKTEPMEKVDGGFVFWELDSSQGALFHWANDGWE
jgi:site-specific DNA-cytosine methylase